MRPFVFFLLSCDAFAPVRRSRSFASCDGLRSPAHPHPHPHSLSPFSSLPLSVPILHPTRARRPGAASLLPQLPVDRPSASQPALPPVDPAGRKSRASPPSRRPERPDRPGRGGGTPSPTRGRPRGGPRGCPRRGSFGSFRRFPPRRGCVRSAERSSVYNLRRWSASPFHPAFQREAGLSEPRPRRPIRFSPGRWRQVRLPARNDTASFSL